MYLAWAGTSVGTSVMRIDWEVTHCLPFLDDGHSLYRALRQ